jgi:hypothetical protein
MGVDHGRERPPPQAFEVDVYRSPASMTGAIAPSPGVAIGTGAVVAGVTTGAD